MSAQTVTASLANLEAATPCGHGSVGPVPVRIVVAYGFWLFRLSDIITGPSRSAFLSAFFSLVGLHGAHVTAPLLPHRCHTAPFRIDGKLRKTLFL
jgi:hypothetical protein